MKYFILLLSLFITFSIASEAYSATCSSTSRTNYSTGQTLTSSALNADFNQLVSKVNSLDGGCVTDGTLEASALSAADFATVTNGIHQGCALAYVDGNTVQVGKCILSVNGAFVKTTATTNVTWGCSGCSSEVAVTVYYVYAKTGSTGTTLNLLISTTAPGVDGYDASSNKVLGRFVNNAASAIDKASLDNWSSNGFIGSDAFKFSIVYGGTTAQNTCTTGDCYIYNPEYPVAGVSYGGSTGVYNIGLLKDFTSISCVGSVASGIAAANVGQFSCDYPGTTTSTLQCVTTVGGAFTNTFGSISCSGRF
jgi:hypothetical protein